MNDFAILRVQRLPADELAELVAESEMAGFRFVRRLVEEWRDRRNRFDRPGEALFAAICGERMVGVCGLNVDPYATDSGAGRVRHLYVSPAFRRQGIGRRLVDAIVAAAQGHFNVLRLRTDSAAAARFYEAIEFRACRSADCTHRLELARWS